LSKRETFQNLSSVIVLEEPTTRGLVLRPYLVSHLWQGISSHEDIVGLQYRGDYVILWEV